MSLSKENKVIIDGQTYYGGLNQPPKFVKVNVDCWEKIFDYLSLCDILSMSQTCQRMRQIGGYYFRENFHGTGCELNKDSGPFIYIRGGLVEIERDDFLRFVDTAHICCFLGHLKHYSSMNLLGSLTTLRLWNVLLHANANGYFEKRLLDNIETVQLDDCTIHDDFDGKLFASCSKLKCLKVYRLAHTSETSENSLLRYTYPMLEHFKYTGFMNEPVPLFISFLERNSSLKSLQIDADYLFKIGLNTSTVQLDNLTVEARGINVGVVELANLLKTLHANGFYQKLHLSLVGDNEMLINQMISFGALEALKIYNFHANICHLTELKELQLTFGQLAAGTDLDSFAKNLTKLERLYIRGTVDHLIPFLRNSKALKMAILSDRDNSPMPLDLSYLNQVRQLGGAQRKVLIGVHGNQYLATKWNSMNMSYDLVGITRMETIRERFKVLAF